MDVHEVLAVVVSSRIDAPTCSKTSQLSAALAHGGASPFLSSAGASPMSIPTCDAVSPTAQATSYMGSLSRMGSLFSNMQRAPSSKSPELPTSLSLLTDANMSNSRDLLPSMATVPSPSAKRKLARNSVSGINRGLADFELMFQLEDSAFDRASR